MLTYVLKVVPPKLVGELFPERIAFWPSLLTGKIRSLVGSAVAKYSALYKECGKSEDKNAGLYMKWPQYERNTSVLLIRTKNLQLKTQNELLLH